MIESARARGYATADEEMEPGLVSVAAPVRDPAGPDRGGVQRVGTRSTGSRRVSTGVGAALVAAAGELGAALRGERPADVAEGG